MRTSLRIRRRARVAAVLLLAGGSALSWVPPASAVTVDASGWWWRANDSALPVDVPPRADVGTDQLLVEGEPEGATAVAAVRFTLAEGETSPILTLTPTQDSVLPPEAVVLACRVGSSWEPAQGGKWQRKPIPDCFSSVQGIPSDGGTLTFALTPLQSGTTLEIVIAPGVNPTAVNDNARFSSFSLKFPKPTSADLKTSSGDAGGFSGVGGDFSSPDPSEFGAEGSTSDGTSSSFDGGTSSGSSFDSTGGSLSTTFGPSPAFSQPSTFSPPATVAPSASAALPASEQAGPTGVAPVQAAPAANTADTPRGRTFGILVLLAGAALGFWAYTGSASGAGRVAMVPAAPAPGTEPVVGGLGRFARPRLGPPPSLS
jgi:hypothetical protein